MNTINRLRVLAGLDPLKESAPMARHDASPAFDHAEYARKVKSMPDEMLRFIIKDAHEAMDANPESAKAKSGFYADEINYCAGELYRREHLAKQQMAAESVNQPVEETAEVVEETAEVVEETAEVKELEFETKNAFTDDSYEPNPPAKEVSKKADTLNRYKTPKDVTKACKDRIAEIEGLIASDDEKGYNDNSVREQVIDCIKQIMDDLSTNDYEGYRKAVIYHTTLASQYLHWLPNQLIKYLTQG